MKAYILFGGFFVIIACLYFFSMKTTGILNKNNLDVISEKYGGVYVFYPEFREEIKKRERERKEEDDKLIAIAKKETNKIVKEKYGFTDEDIKAVVTPQGDYFKKNQYNEVWREVTKEVYAGFEEKYPQTLSNGCKYYNQAFGPYDAIFEPYYEKIKEFVGEEVYKRLKPSLKITSFYRCKDGSEGLITIYTDIYYTKTKFGLFGDEGRGFSLSKAYSVDIGGSNTFELRDGKFIKTQEIARDFL